MPCQHEILHAVEERSLPDQNTQRTQGRNQDGRRKGVRSKVGDFTKSHCEPVSFSECQIWQLVSVRVTIPPHHTGLFKYENPSPSNPCRSEACIKPCIPTH